MYQINYTNLRNTYMYTWNIIEHQEHMIVLCKVSIKCDVKNSIQQTRD
jgi:hypothetical protein